MNYCINTLLNQEGKKVVSVNLKNAYYLFKPFFPRYFQILLRRARIRIKSKKYSHLWPIDESAGNPPSGWQGWPDGKQFALLITHDVESQRGLEKVKQLAEIDLKYGFKSSFSTSITSAPG